MLEDKDIQKLIEVFPVREEVVTKKDFQEFREEMKKEFSNLYSAIDSYAKKADDYFKEMWHWHIKLIAWKSRFTKSLRKLG